MQTTFNHKSRKGFTLTEAAIVLGIMGLILGAIWVAAAAVYANMRVNKTSTQLTQIAQGMRSLYATSNSMGATAITMTNLAKTNVFPNDMVDLTDATTPVKNVWNGAVTVVRGTIATAGDSFIISFANVPQSACTELLVRNTGTPTVSWQAGVGTKADAAALATTAASPMSPTDAVTACTGATNTVWFGYSLKG